MELVTLNEKEYRSFTDKMNTHFLESYEWGELSLKRGFTPYYIGLKDKNTIVATALLLKKNLLMGYSYFYIPRGFNIDYNNEELIKIFSLKIKKFCKEKKGIFFRIDPDIKLHTIDENACEIEGTNNYKLVNFLESIGYKHRPLTKYFETMQPRFTFRIDLKPSIEEIEKKYSTTTIQRIKKAKKCGVTVEIGTKEDIKEFNRLMKMTEERQGFYSHDDKYFSSFYDVFSKNNHVTLYLGKIDIKKIELNLKTELNKLNEEYKIIENLDNKKSVGQKKELIKNINSINEQLDFFKDKPKNTIVVSSYLIVHYGNKSWALYAANDMNYKRLYANYLVYEKQIQDSKKRGIEIFDVFGTIGEPTSDSQLVGLHDFKKKWGGEYTEFIGEFDYITNKFMYFLYNKLIPIRHKIINKKLKNSIKKK